MFKVKTIESVLKSFNKAINDLEVVATSHINDSYRKTNQASKLKEEALFHAEEGQKALSIANKLKELVS